MSETYILLAEGELSPEKTARLSALVSPEKQARLSRIRRVRDRQNALIGDILVRSEICKRTGLQNRQLSFGQSETGKPFLIGHPNLHFNLSHAGTGIAMAMDDCPTGIDIETYRPVDKKLILRYFSPDEQAYLMAAAPEEEMRRFFEIWTKKESFIKHSGLGLSQPLNSFSVLQENPALFFHPVFEDGLSVCHLCTTKKERGVHRTLPLSQWLESISDFLQNTD